MNGTLCIFLQQTSLSPYLQWVVLKFCRPQIKTVAVLASGSGVEIMRERVTEESRVFDLYCKYLWMYVYVDKDGEILHPQTPLTKDVYALYRKWSFPDEEVLVIRGKNPSNVAYPSTQQNTRWTARRIKTGPKQYILVDDNQTNSTVFVSKICLMDDYNRLQFLLVGDYLLVNLPDGMGDLRSYYLPKSVETRGIAGVTQFTCRDNVVYYWTSSAKWGAMTLSKQPLAQTGWCDRPLLLDQPMRIVAKGISGPNILDAIYQVAQYIVAQPQPSKVL